MLCVLDRLTRVVNVVVAFALSCVEAKLDFVDAVSEAKEGEVSAFDCRHKLLILIVDFASLVEGGYRDEVSELLSSSELSQSDALVHLLVERDTIKCLLQVKAVNLVIHECLLGKQKEVLLESFADLVSLEALEK